MRLIASVLFLLLAAASLPAQSVPAGFEVETALNGLVAPVNVEFAPDGRVFVAEKSGVIKIFDSVNDPTPGIFANLAPNVHDFWDRGALGLAIHPEFPTVPYVYLLYTLDAPVGGTPPVFNDACSDPTGSGCVVGARLSRLTADGDVMTGPEEILIEGWCQQYPSHSIGDIEFGLDGALYLTAGDGASFNFPDFGQIGNPCADPFEEGGALRSQDLQTAGDPVNYDGCVLRLDPLTGEALPDNPLFGGADPDDDRIIAYGLRNPFRFAVHPVSGELYIGDVGWFRFEEINRVQDPVDLVVENFGWPCYEGFGHQFEYDGENLAICESLYASDDVTDPVFAYNHSGPIVPGGCSSGGSAISGLAIYDGGSYPPEYDGALFFSDFNRQCLTVMFPDAGGVPDPTQVTPFGFSMGGVVDLEIGPGGDVFYADIVSATIRRIRSTLAPRFIRGDGNGDGSVDIGDPVFNLDYLFNDGPSQCLDAQDTNDDGSVNVADPVHNLTFQFSMGPPPPPPFGDAPLDCGEDPTDDQGGDLGCEGPVPACP